MHMSGGYSALALKAFKLNAHPQTLPKFGQFPEKIELSRAHTLRACTSAVTLS